MRLKADQAILVGYSDKMGKEDAALAIRKALKCSISKAEKMARGEYPFGLSEFEQVALVRLVKIPKDVLFPGSTKAKAAAS